MTAVSLLGAFNNDLELAVDMYMGGSAASSSNSPHPLPHRNSAVARKNNTKQRPARFTVSNGRNPIYVNSDDEDKPSQQPSGSLSRHVSFGHKCWRVS